MTDFEELIGESRAIEAVRSDLRRLLGLAREGRRLPPVLIQGETGTGKSLIAKILHRYGPRARGPFVDVNCAAIPETLMEAELFGYERGAFTDARRAKPGLFQTSSGGVLFLDEVALLPESLQAKLLTAIEEQSVRRLGGTTKESFDSWLVSASNTDLRLAVRERRFREDLYHRLAVLSLRLPPLRERAADIVILAQRFLDRACQHYGVPAKSFAPAARAAIAGDPWPGNVRELVNVAERLALLADGRDIGVADVEAAFGTDVRSLAPSPAPSPSPDRPASAGDRERLLAALEATGGNIVRTAAMLGLSRNTVRARMDRMGLRARRDADASGPPPVPSRRPPASVTPLPAPTPPVDAVRWERRHVTLLRVTLAETAAGSVDAGHLLSLAAEKVSGFGGRIEALGGASFDASFGVVPVENATRRAVSAGLAAHRAVSDAGRPGVGVIIVAHTAQTTVGQVAGTLVIDERDRTGLADRLDSLAGRARPGAVQVSAATAPFLERHFELHVADPASASAEASFTVVRRDPTGLGAWRRLTRFVGRQTEMDLLRSRWDLARQGRGQVVAVVGEPGSGKSRLLLEFCRTLDPGAAVVLRVAVAATEDPSRRRPAGVLVGALLGIEAGDGPGEIREKVAEQLRVLDLDAALLPVLAALLDVDAGDHGWASVAPQQRARRVLDALRLLITRASAVRPLVIVLEDLHWVDADTHAALDQLIDVVPTARVLFVVAYRPEFQHRWAAKTFYTQLRVDPLPAAAAGDLLDDLLGAPAELAALKHQLLVWTEGNPFFLEETVRTLIETGGLAGTPGAYRVVGDVAERTLPSTVEDALASRLHRLSGDVRHTLQCAAIIGVEFAVPALRSLADLPDDVMLETLRVLEDGEFVYPMAGPSEPTYMFKHALTHLVAYRSVPADRQKTLHARVLPTLESLHAAHIDAHAEVLAEHALRGELWEKGAMYCHVSGTRAMARSATRTAVHQLERALTALQKAGARRDLRTRAIDVRLDLRYALALLGEHERTLPYLREAEAIALELDDVQRLGRVVSFLANALYNLGDHAGAIASSDRARQIAERHGDFATRVTADIYAGRALHVLGRYREATDLFRAVVELLRGGRANEYAGLPVLPSAYARSYLIMGLGELGEFTAADGIAREAIAIAEATAHPDTIQWVCYAVGLVALDRGDVDAAIAPLERALSICRSAELPVYVPRTTALLGHAYALAGRADGTALLEAAAAEIEAPSHRNSQARVFARLAEVLVLTGKFRDGADRAARAVALAREHGERGSEAHALRALGIAHTAEARLDAAHVALEDGAELARALGMLPLAALCRLGLGRLASVAKRGEEARREIAAAHEAMTHLGMLRWEQAAAAELAQLD